MKKKFLFVATAVLIMATLFTFVGCKKLTPPSPTPGPAVKAKVKSKDVYAMSAVSSVGYLNTAGSAKVAMQAQNGGISFAKMAATDILARPEQIGEDIVKINDYVNMFKGMLLGGDLGYQVTVPTADDGVYATYKVKMTIALPSVGTEKNSYVMYFNETPKDVTPEAPEEEENKDETQKDEKVKVAAAVEETPAKDATGEAPTAKDPVPPVEEEEIEVSSSLDGVMIYNGEKFIVTGEKTVETEGTETETEIVFTTKSEANPANYIVVAQSVELGEVEYEYSIYENNVLMNQTNIEWESEEGEDEFELQFIDTASGTPTDTIYKIEKKLEGEVVIFEIEYSVNGKISTIKVVPGETTNEYVYENGFKEVI